MREIKFRIWAQSQSYDANVGDYKMHYEGDSLIAGYHVGPFGCFKDKNLTFMQYTGLKDKNCKEIYEGDIVKVSYDYGDGYYFIYELFWNNTMFSLRLLKVDFEGIFPHREDDMVEQFDDQEWEIIGNVYENPELLID